MDPVSTFYTTCNLLKKDVFITFCAFVKELLAIGGCSSNFLSSYNTFRTLSQVNKGLGIRMRRQQQNWRNDLTRADSDGKNYLSVI